MGLGLHIVRSIINLHSGDIMVRSVEGGITVNLSSACPTLHQKWPIHLPQGEKGSSGVLLLKVSVKNVFPIFQRCYFLHFKIAGYTDTSKLR